MQHCLEVAYGRFQNHLQPYNNNAGPKFTNDVLSPTFPSPNHRETVINNAWARSTQSAQYFRGDHATDEDGFACTYSNCSCTLPKQPVSHLKGKTLFNNFFLNDSSLTSCSHSPSTNEDCVSQQPLGNFPFDKRSIFSNGPELNSNYKHSMIQHFNNEESLDSTYETTQVFFPSNFQSDQYSNCEEDIRKISHSTNASVSSLTYGWESPISYNMQQCNVAMQSDLGCVYPLPSSQTNIQTDSANFSENSCQAFFPHYLSNNPVNVFNCPTNRHTDDQCVFLTDNQQTQKQKLQTTKQNNKGMPITSQLLKNSENSSILSDSSSCDDDYNGSQSFRNQLSSDSSALSSADCSSYNELNSSSFFPLQLHNQVNRIPIEDRTAIILKEDHFLRSGISIGERGYANEENIMRHSQELYKCNNALKDSSNNILMFDKQPSEISNRSFACPITNCKKIFIRMDELNRHFRSHSGQRPFVCNTCQRRLLRSDHLKTHIRTHTGEKPYKCPVCSKRFSRRDGCERHKKIHQKNKNNKLRKATFIKKTNE